MTGKRGVVAQRQWFDPFRFWRGMSAAPAEVPAPQARRGLAMVIGFIEPHPPPLSPLEFCHAPTGVEAIRLFYRQGVKERLELILVEDGLLDMPGLGLLRRLGTEAPAAARVLLLDPDYEIFPPDELAEIGIDDTWIMPGDGRKLARRALAQREILARTRAVHRRLEGLTSDLEDLEKRYFYVRSARDRLARNVQTALMGDEHHKSSMLRWWQGYRAIVQLRVGCYPIAPQRRRVVDLLGTILAHEDLLRWSFPTRMPAKAEVWVDSALVELMGRSLFRGILEAAETFARPRWGRVRTEQDLLIIELKIEPVLECVEDADELLEDPFARLPDGPLRQLSIDLPLANEMLQAMGGRLEGQLVYPELVVELRMPRRCPQLVHPLAHPPQPVGKP